MSGNQEKKPAWGAEIMAKFIAQADAEAAALAKIRELERKRRQESREMEPRAQSEAFKTASGLEEQAAQAARGLEQQSAQEVSEPGTRSPSTIPNRLLIPQIPTSLRTVATLIPDPVFEVAQNEGDSGVPESSAAKVKPESVSPVHEDVDMDEAQISDDDDDDEDESLLNDDLQLQAQEYIVPLPIQGRQADTYRERSKELSELLVSLPRNPREAERKIEKVLNKVRSIETHVDLIWSGNSIPQPNDDQQVQDQHLVQWSYDYSVKFRFLGALLSKLQERDLHVILLIEKEDNTRLFNIIESFLRGTNFSFDSPVTGQTHHATDETDKDKARLKITILSCTSSQVTRETHLIVCLDGKPDVEEIRKKPWALKPDRSGVPILHLVIPRTIGHLDHYMSTKISVKRRLHTIIATLSQFASHHEIGQAVNYVPPKSYEVGFADEVVKYLFPSEDGPTLSEWPLPAIGSIKDIIEYQCQQSLETLSPASPFPGSIAAGKRPLIQNDDRNDPAKRMRFTPQPHTQADTSHVSDSTPGASLSVEQERDLWKQEAKRLEEVEKAYVKQQWKYEETRNTYSVLKDEKEALERKLAENEERNAKLREQLNTRTIDNVELRKQLDEQRGLNSLSEDDKVLKIAEKNIEIDNLKEEVAKQVKAIQDAIDNKRYAETNRDYVQERFREAQSEATSATQELQQVKEELAKLKRGAKAQPLLQQHQQRQEQLAANKEVRIANENNILKKQLQVKSQEAEKYKAEMERMRTTRGVWGGTRAASAGPRTPRPGSRAASPLPNGRDRLANLRNG